MSKSKKGRRRSRRQQRQQRRNMLGVTLILFVMVGVLMFGSMNLRAKNRAYATQEEELQTKIEEQETRSEEIDDLEKEITTDEYIEQIAREKLGLIFEGETLFKRK